MKRPRSGGDGPADVVDDRLERRDTPQYQRDTDERAAAEAHEGQTCLVCEGIDY